MITTSSSLADILRESPASVGVFHSHGLDYCCGGKASLSTACVAKGIDAGIVLRELITVSRRHGHGNLHIELWSTEFLVAYIINNHHAFVRYVLPLASEQMQRVVTKHGERFLDATAVLDLLEDLQASLVEHLAEEERELFAVPLSPRAQAEISIIIQQHELEHEEVGRKLQRLRAITCDFTPPAGACTTHQAAYDTMRRFYEDTMQHVYLENAILFPQMLADVAIQSTTLH